MKICSVSIQRPPCVKGAAAQSARLGDCLSQQACTCLFLRKTTPPPLRGTSPYTGEALAARYRYQAVIANQPGSAGRQCVHRWLVFATDEYSLGVVTKLSLRTSPQTGVAIRSPLRIDHCRLSVKEYGLPRRVCYCVIAPGNRSFRSAALCSSQ